MSYGLQVWDAKGNLTLDISSRITRIHSQVSVPELISAASKAISVTGIIDDGTWGCLVPEFIGGEQVRVSYEITSGYITFTADRGNIVPAFKASIMRF